jgi:hypothetical protein
LELLGGWSYHIAIRLRVVFAFAGADARVPIVRDSHPRLLPWPAPLGLTFHSPDMGTLDLAFALLPRAYGPMHRPRVVAPFLCTSSTPQTDAPSDDSTWNRILAREVRKPGLEVRFYVVFTEVPSGVPFGSSVSAFSAALLDPDDAWEASSLFPKPVEGKKDVRRDLPAGGRTRQGVHSRQ